MLLWKSWITFSVTLLILFQLRVKDKHLFYKAIPQMDNELVGETAQHLPGMTCRQTDSLVLVDLYLATDGENWGNSWNLQEPMQDWHGVSLNANGCVSVVELIGNGLNGSLPETLANLSELQILNLDFNELSGPLPEFPKLSGVIEFLSLDANNFTGAIPVSYGSLQNLRVLEISENNLEGAIPPELGQLSQLVFLSLYSCGLNGIIPPEIGLLTKLEYLSLFNNNLNQEIPEALSACTKLKELYLDENDFIGSLPDGLTQLNQLEIFRISGNQLSGIINDHTEHWPNIRQFYFLDNKYTFESFLHFLDDLSGQIAGNSQVPEDEVIYAPQDSIFRDTFIQKNVGDDLTIDLGIDVSIVSNVYEWYKDGQFFKSIQGVNKLELTDLSSDDSGVYHCEVSNPNAPDLFLLSRSIRINVTVQPLSFDLQVDQNASCAGKDDGQVSIMVNGGEAPYQLQLNEGSSFNFAQSNFTLEALEQGTYTFFIADNLGTEIEGTFSISAPAPLNIELPQYQHNVQGQVCSGTITLAPNGGEPPYQVDWDDGGTGSMRTGLCAGSYTPTLTDANNCSLVLAPIVINTFEIVEEEVIRPVCAGENSGSISLSVNGGEPPLVFSWVDSNGQPIAGQSTLENLSPGFYTLTLSESSGRQIVRNYTLEPEFSNDFLLRNDEYNFSELNLSFEQKLDILANDELTDSNSYTIDILETLGADMFSVVGNSVFFRPTSSFEGELVVTYRLCTAECLDLCETAMITVLVDQEEDIFVPESFSPNGDGWNDRLVIPAIRDNPEDYPLRELTVVNRWGHVVFQSKPYNNDWDGTGLHGKLLPTGTYYYIVRLNIGEGKIKRGSILLLR